MRTPGEVVQVAEVGVRELKQRASEIIRQVREERATYTITYRGRVVARLVPEEDEESRRKRALAALAEIDRVAAEISKHWPPGVSAVEAIREVRRDL